jgi:transcriptional regulator with XRE-family HTH domain
MLLGARVRAARRRARSGDEITQVELGRLSGLGQQVVSKIERGAQKTLSPDQVQCLARALGEDPYYLFTGTRPHEFGPVAGRIHQIESAAKAAGAPLDFYAADNIIAVAEREAQRVREQNVESEFERVRQALITAGVDRDLLDRAAPAAMKMLLERESAAQVDAPAQEAGGPRRD